jgi:hypothetical protein
MCEHPLMSTSSSIRAALRLMAIVALLILALLLLFVDGAVLFSAGFSTDRSMLSKAAAVVYVVLAIGAASLVGLRSRASRDPFGAVLLGASTSIAISLAALPFVLVRFAM